MGQLHVKETRDCWTGVRTFRRSGWSSTLVEVHRLSSARLFGDADSDWVSSSWTPLVQT
ncbi:MAG: hypothetical protein R3C68_01690 [Myxococcota bacterium]